MSLTKSYNNKSFLKILQQTHNKETNCIVSIKNEFKKQIMINFNKVNKVILFIKIFH